MRIGCYHEDAQGSCHPMTQIGRTTDGDLVATYADGHRVLVGAMGGKVPVLAHDIGDEPYVRLVDAPRKAATPPDAIENAFRLWTSTMICAVDPAGQAFSVHQLTGEGMVLRDSDGDMDTFAHVEDGRPLCAVWDGEHLLGFAYGGGTPLVRAGRRFIGAEVERVRARLRTMATRLRGDWTIVSGEGERVGTDASGIVVGGLVQVGVQPVAPMPTDGRAEWMWVEVTRISGDRIHGILRNQPGLFAISLQPGDEMSFDRRDVYALEKRTRAA